MKNSYLDKIGLNALNASRNLSLLNEKKKNKILKDFYKNFKQNQKRILKANKTDISRANKNKVSKNLVDRLLLNEHKINSILNSIQAVIKLKDPTQ
jgi:glutamate-5-semialdehyde dehydrogenase